MLSLDAGLAPTRALCACWTVDLYAGWLELSLTLLDAHAAGAAVTNKRRSFINASRYKAVTCSIQCKKQRYVGRERRDEQASTATGTSADQRGKQAQAKCCNGRSHGTTRKMVSLQCLSVVGNDSKAAGPHGCPACSMQQRRKQSSLRLP